MKEKQKPLDASDLLIERRLFMQFADHFQIASAQECP
jgi:hypothetical protein